MKLRWKELHDICSRPDQMKERVRWTGHVARGVGENKYVQNAAERTDVSTWTRMGDNIKMGINFLKPTGHVMHQQV